MYRKVWFGGACVLSFALVGCGGGGASGTNSSTNIPMLVIQGTNILKQNGDGSKSTILASSENSDLTAESADATTIAVPTTTSDNHFDVSIYNTLTGAGSVAYRGLPHSSLALSPDSSSLAYIDNSGAAPQIKTVDRTGTTATWGPSVAGLSLTGGLSWDPQGRYIAVTRSSRTDVLLIPKDGAAEPIEVAYGSNPAFSPDGSLLAFVAPMGELGYYDVNTKQSWTVHPVNQIKTVAFTSDGANLIVTALRPDGPSYTTPRAATMKVGSDKLAYVPLSPPTPQFAIGPAVP